ncbi:hypothetical protein B0H63DRAFT_488832 [Podospora didyma]|uniref:DUF7580 domain-containing protein n=1 Tax=Podospora didyma TaxID=330526 RepID=A0AAE0K3A8_9PEZI|nr:hypothetical protein B0H63DRAFT_488832 [Podospora didyma]
MASPRNPSPLLATMLDFSILEDVLQIFPDVTAAVDKYKEARPGHTARSIARRLANEETLYSQFTQKLLLLSHAPSIRTDGLHEKILVVLGAGVANLILASLKEMQRQLRELRKDLDNNSRGTEVLGKIDELGRKEEESQKLRSKQEPGFKLEPKIDELRSAAASTSRSAKATKTLIQKHLRKRLDELSALNTNLAGYLLKPQMPLLAPPGTSNVYPFFHHDRRKPADLLPALGAEYGCDCRERHAVYLRCRCPKCNPSFQEPEPKGDVWDFEVIPAPYCPLEQPNAPGKSNGQSRGHGTLTEPSENLDGLGCKFGNSKSNKAFTCLEELTKRRNTILDQKMRMEIAFRLSSAVLQFANTPLIDHSWTLEDWAVAFDDQEDEAPNVFLRRSLNGPQKSAMKKEGPVESAWSIVAREPILTKLGLSLIELGLGRRLSDIYHEEPGLLRKDDMREFDSDSWNVFTARRLLSLGLIAQRISPDFQDVVSACVNQQYRDGRDAKVKELDTQEQFFLEHATVAILMPLYQEVRKYLGYNRVGAHTKVTTRISIKEVRKKRGDPDAAKHIPAPRKAFEPSTPKAGHSPAPSCQLGGDGHEGSTSLGDTPDNKSGGSTFTPLRSSNELEHSNNSVDVMGPSPNDSESGGSSDSMIIHNGHEEEPSGLAEDTSISKSAGGRNTVQVGPDSGSLVEADGPAPVSSSAATSEYDDVSYYSYEAYTESTDSAFAWLPDDQPVHRLPANHPLLQYREVALHTVLRQFDQWMAAGNADAGGSVYSVATSHAGSTRNLKRARPSLGKTNIREQDDEEEDAPGKSPQTGRKRRRLKDEGITFACPFLKKDPVLHQACCGYALTRIRDVKQHLGRRHQMPIYCLRCFLTFEDELERDVHARDAGCDLMPYARPEGITEAQKRMLAKKAPSTQTAEEQWYGIFDILFPNHDPKPISPYMDQDRGLIRSSIAYQGFLLEHGTHILSRVLIDNGAVMGNLAYGEREREAFLHQILEDGFRNIFDQWSNREGGPSSASESRATAPSTQDDHSEVGQVQTPDDRQPQQAVETTAHQQHQFNNHINHQHQQNVSPTMMYSNTPLQSGSYIPFAANPPRSLNSGSFGMEDINVILENFQGGGFGGLDPMQVVPDSGPYTYGTWPSHPPGYGQP